MSVLVVGSVALDSVETPFGERENVLGGSATYFAAAASLLTRVSVVGVVGEDFPHHELEFLKKRGVALDGLSRVPGKTFRWKGKYGFDRVIDVWGADHHGYIPRMRAGLRALGYPEDFFEVSLVQLVKVVKGGEEVRMSKRAGDFVTLRELLDWVGSDAARYFFLMRKGETPFVFDVDLARKQTDENPVFYVQMAHARLSGIFRVAGVAAEGVGETAELAALPAAEDSELLKALTRFPELVAGAARAREPHRITGYLEELARLVHYWYHHCRVLGEPEATERARLVLARAARQVLRNGLGILGLSAPDRM